MPQRDRWLLAVAMALAACTGAVDGGMDMPGPGGEPAGSQGLGGGAPGPGGPGAPGGPGNPPVSAACVQVQAEVGPTAVRRLTVEEYRNTVRDLFPGVSITPPAVAHDPTVSGFSNDARAQTVSPLLVEQYDRAAAEIADQAVGQLAAWAPCGTDAGEACALQIARGFATKAYRRPLAADEIERIEGFVRENLRDYGFQASIRMVLHGVLASPHFLYRPEAGIEGDRGPLRRLTSFELASRLSYLFWRSMPDEGLWQAAEQDALLTDSGLRTQVERLLEDPRAEATVADFHTQWLQLQRLDSVDLDPERFPELTEVREDLKRSALRFVAEQFWHGSVQSLFTSSETFVNDRLAGLLGVPAPNASELVPVALDPAQRAGVLTQPGVLASTSHGMTHSPILRGVTVLRNVLCTDLPAPPPDVQAAIPDPPPGEVFTTRQQVEESHGTVECSGCHGLIDPVGFTFEHYDALGRYRDTENGMPVDASGELTRSGDVDGSYANAVELSARFAESEQVRYCVAKQWFRYAMGRGESSQDTCAIAELGERLAADGSMRAMWTALATSQAFRFLNVETRTTEGS